MHQSIYIVLCIFGMLTNLNAQSASNSEVYKTLKSKDSLIFERSFNNCELDYLDQLIAEDFEFYHDISGIETSKANFIDSMRNGICNPQNTTTSRRELVKGSLEVFPLKRNGQIYGALQNGIHQFYEITNDVELKGSIAKFSHLWILENNKWLLKRVISYDHQLH